MVSNHQLAPRVCLLLVAFASLAAEDGGCATNRDIDEVVLKDAAADAMTSGEDAGVDPMPDGSTPTDAVVTLDAAPDDWWDTAYRRRVEIRGTYDRDASAANIPIVLHLSDNVAVDAEPRELRFVDADGIVFQHEVVEWGERKTVWVLVPELEARSMFWMYWDNPDSLDVEDPEAVWGENFEFVGHLESEQPYDVLDVTRKANISGDPMLVEGIAGSAYDFDGDDTLNFDLDPDQLDGVPAETQYTWEAWFKMRTPGDDRLIFNNEGFCSGVRIGVEADASVEVHFSGGGMGEEPQWCDSYTRKRIKGAPLSVDEWHYVVAWIDRINQELVVQVDAEDVGRAELTEVPHGEGAFLTIGGNHVGTNGFDGVIDEARISSVRRSEEWVVFQNLATRDLLFEYGTPEQI